MCICNFFPLCHFSHYFSIYMFAFNGGVYSFGACLLSDFQLVDPSSYVIDAQTDSSVYSVMASVAEIMYFNFRNCMDITTVQI